MHDDTFVAATLHLGYLLLPPPLRPATAGVSLLLLLYGHEPPFELEWAF